MADKAILHPAGNLTVLLRIVISLPVLHVTDKKTFSRICMTLEGLLELVERSLLLSLLLVPGVSVSCNPSALASFFVSLTVSADPSEGSLPSVQMFSPLCFLQGVSVWLLFLLVPLALTASSTKSLRWLAPVDLLLGRSGCSLAFLFSGDNLQSSSMMLLGSVVLQLLSTNTLNASLDSTYDRLLILRSQFIRSQFIEICIRDLISSSTSRLRTDRCSVEPFC